MGMLALFGIEVLFTATLSIRMLQSFGSSPGGASVIVGATMGAALLVTPYVASLADGGYQRILMRAAAMSLTVSAVGLVFAYETGVFVLFVIATALLGISRAVCIVMALTSVAALPYPPHATQGLNGVVQRLGSVLASGLAGLALAQSGWLFGNLTLLAMAAVWTTCAWVFASGFTGKVLSSWQPQQSFKKAINLLRFDARIRASGFINLVTLFTILTTNTFIPLVIEREAGPQSVGFAVGVILASRECIAILAGLAFVRWGHRFATGNVVTIALGLVATSFVLLSIPGFDLLRFCLASAAQGIALALFIASTNLLVIESARHCQAAPEGMTLRLAATQLPPALGILVCTPLLGLFYDHTGQLAFGMALLMCTIMGSKLIYDLRSTSS